MDESNNNNNIPEKQNQEEEDYLQKTDRFVTAFCNCTSFSPHDFPKRDAIYVCCVLFFYFPSQFIFLFQCKHILAVRISHALKRIRIKEVNDSVEFSKLIEQAHSRSFISPSKFAKKEIYQQKTGLKKKKKDFFFVFIIDRSGLAFHRGTKNRFSWQWVYRRLLAACGQTSF